MAHAKQIFLSTVTKEFKYYRDELRGQLTRFKVGVAVQEDFIAGGGTTLLMGVLQGLAGDNTGC